MKQVTIDTVSERIAELEMVHSHGELSLRGEFELACLRMLAASHEREKVRAMHAVWSQATFGDVGPIGPLKHLAKEAMEAAAAPGDISEWADMQFLLWDAQRRAGITEEQITQAMIDKLEVNKARQWPEPKDGEPRLHIQADNDNTAQQFESLATSAQREPVAAVKHYTGNEYPTLKFAQNEWCVCGDREDAQELADAINALATRAGSGKSEHLLNAERIAREAKALSDRLNATSAGSGKP